MTGSNENVGNSIQTSQYDTPNNTYTGSVFEQMTRTTKGNVLKEGSVDRLNKVEIQTPRTPFF